MSIDLAVVAANKPSTNGCTIYLNSGGSPEGMLRRAADASGEILQEVQFMGDMVGYVGFFKDTEGNRIGVRLSRRRCENVRYGSGTWCATHATSRPDCPRCGEGWPCAPRLVRNR